MTTREHRLLVITDGSPADAEVLAAACRLVRPHHSTVTLLRVIAPPLDAPRPRAAIAADLLPAIDRAEHDALASLERQARTFRAARVTPVVLVGAQQDEIARWLAQHPADEVVLPVRARRGPFRWWSGHEAEALARRGHTPVIAVYPAPASLSRRPTTQAA